VTHKTSNGSSTEKKEIALKWDVSIRGHISGRVRTSSTLSLFIWHFYMLLTVFYYYSKTIQWERWFWQAKMSQTTRPPYISTVLTEHSSNRNTGTPWRNTWPMKVILQEVQNNGSSD